VATLDDIYALKEIEASGVDSVIIGKALYEGRFTIEDASTPPKSKSCRRIVPQAVQPAAASLPPIIVAGPLGNVSA
jgi:hypothetical protein